MELTQKLECTQDLYSSTIEKEVPDQIGFLGICGIKYPLKKGPNKIGRDPDTCNIVLNLNSISRQHAVINILNSHDFMLMDLDSANKTKLADKTLQAYIPTPLKNGDMVQFGQVFGVFRLFVEDNDLPMTQALDIPDTPVRNHVSKANLITTIPESPEVSDRDDSFIVASQPKSSKIFKSPSAKFVKSSGKTVTIKPVGSNKIDNVYWSSSKKSDSFTSESDTSMNKSLQTKTKESIHEQDTQVHSNLIYEADTQVGDAIFNTETQLPRVDLPEVHKVHGQENVNIDLFTDKENIYNTETQDVSLLKTTSDVSDDVILFDEIENNQIEENFGSQSLVLPELEANHNEISNDIDKSDGEKPRNIPVSDRRDSGSSTDCEDIDFALTQKIPERQTNDDDTTDCEDAPELNNDITQKANPNIDDDLTDCEDDDNNRNQKDKIDMLEDLPTQIIEEIPIIADLQTQIIEEDKSCRKNQIDLEDLPTQILHESKNNSDQITPFKVPIISPLKRRRKDQAEIINKGVNSNKNATEDEDDENYYAATQEILHDLCSQRELSPEIVSYASISKTANNNQSSIKSTTDLQITEDIDEKIDKFVMNLTNSVVEEKEISPSKNTSSSSSDVEESTPKKLQPLSFLETKLPNTQEIKKYLKLSGYASTESSKGSDTDSNRGSPYIQRKTNRKVVKRVDLTNKFEDERLPDRVITRVRKSTIKNEYSKDSNKILQHDTDHSLEKDTVALSSAFTSNVHEESKNKTSKTDKRNKQEINKSKENNKSTEKNKSKENNKKRENKKSTENNKSIENNKSKESNKSQNKNKSKDSNKIQANDSCKENNKIPENIKSKENNTILKNKDIQENNKRKIKNDKQNNNENDSLNKNKIEEKSTRKSTRRKDKQNGGEMDMQVNDEVMLLKTEAAMRTASARKATGSTKTNRKENTIDKYLSSTPALQKDKTRTTEKETKTTEKATKTTEKETKTTEKETKTTEKETKTTEKRSSRSKTKETNSEASIDTEVRRSKRQRTTKSYDHEPKSKQIKPNQSAVYNISSESGVDSPNLKRQASDFNLPTAKKTKTRGSGSNVVLRATPARKIRTHYVLFTAFPCEEVKVKLENLGAVIVSDIMQCTVVLTLQIRRTFKLLCAVGLGKPIVGPNWVQACVDTNIIVDPWPYLIKDELTERRFQFNLERILLGNRQFLKGYNVSSTPNIMPSPPEMKLIVECSGGTWNNGGKNWICVSSSTDKSLWTALKRKGAVIVSTEFILGGVLRQTVDIKKNTLA